MDSVASGATPLRTRAKATGVEEIATRAGAVVAVARLVVHAEAAVVWAAAFLAAAVARAVVVLAVAVVAAEVLVAAKVRSAIT